MMIGFLIGKRELTNGANICNNFIFNFLISKAMKKIFFMAAMMLGIASLPSGISAANESANIFSLSATESTVTGDYVGGLTYVSMNGNVKDNVEDLITTVTQSGSNYKLALEPFQIGSMPGTITVTADNVTAGSFSGNCTVTLTIAGVGKDFDGTITGTMSNGSLVYTVDCNATYMLLPFHAVVKFEGEL